MAVLTEKVHDFLEKRRIKRADEVITRFGAEHEVSVRQQIFVCYEPKSFDGQRAVMLAYKEHGIGPEMDSRKKLNIGLKCGHGGDGS